MVQLRLHQVEIVLHGTDGHRLHRLHICAFGPLILLRGNLLLPFEAVIGKKRLLIVERYRLGIVGIAGIAAELVDTRQVGIQGKRTSGERDVLLYLQSELVLHVVVARIHHLTRLVVLEQTQRTVERSKGTIEIQRRKAAGPI